MKAEVIARMTEKSCDRILERIQSAALRGETGLMVHIDRDKADALKELGYEVSYEGGGEYTVSWVKYLNVVIEPIGDSF